MAEAPSIDQLPQRRKNSINEVLGLLQANPDYTFADIKKIIGEQYPRKHATGALFNYIVERIINQYVSPRLDNKDQQQLWRAKAIYEEKQRNEALTDELTQLPRRNLLFHEIRQSLEHGHEPVQKRNFIIIDLDNFKSVNDTYGHTIGDTHLKTFASFLKELFPLCGRWGGEEFAIVDEGPDTEKKIQELRAMYKTFVDYFYSDKKTDKPIGTFSVGIVSDTVSRQDDNLQGKLEEIFSRADDALFWVKEHGKDGIKVWDENIPKKKL